MLTAPRLRTLHVVSRSGVHLSPFLFEDVGSPLNGDAKVRQRQLVSEVLGPFVTQFALNLAREGATPIQRGFDRGLLNRVRQWLQFRPSKPDPYCRCGPIWPLLHWFSRAFASICCRLFSTSSRDPACKWHFAAQAHRQISAELRTS